MPNKLFSVASWNVEHFRGQRQRVADVVQFVRESNADLFAIYEVEGRAVFSEFVKQLPTHHFFITEGEEDMETLVGIRSGMTAFVTQRESFKSKIPTLRPGVLVTVTIDSRHYSLLFLHMKSSSDPHSWGLRDDMIGHVINLKKALDRASDAQGANFLCLGDYNTMGLTVTYADQDMTGLEEVQRYEKRLARVGMRLLAKSSPNTWWGGRSSSYPPSDLDHVFASKHLKFNGFPLINPPAGTAGNADVQVRGWPELPTPAKKDAWIRKHSDHAMLYCEVTE